MRGRSPALDLATVLRVCAGALIVALTPFVIVAPGPTAGAVGGLAFATPGSGDGSTWTPAEAPMPGTAATDSLAILDAIACPAAGTCVMVGNYEPSSDGGTRTFVDMLSGSTWTPILAPLPADASTSYSDQLYAISCPTVDSCVAVGTYEDASGSYQGLVETQTGATWTAENVPVPQSSGFSIITELNAISCPAVGTCVVVGSYTNSDNGIAVPLIESLSAGVWTDIEAPLPAGADGDLSAYLGDVSCPAAGSCVAVGTYNIVSFVSFTTRGQGGLIDTLSGGAWTDGEAPLPSSAQVPHNIVLTAVRCSTPHACVAVGFNGSRWRFASLIETLARGSWTPTETALPAGRLPRYPSPYLSALACPTATTCTAVGYYGDGLGLIDTLSGGTWTGIKAPIPTNAAPKDGFGHLSALGCSTVRSCVALGNYSLASGSDQMLIDTSTGGRWTASEAPLPPDAAPNPSAHADAVACPPVGSCVLVGDYYSTTGNDDIVAETL
jgi:hypothetical protein